MARLAPFLPGRRECAAGSLPSFLGSIVIALRNLARALDRRMEFLQPVERVDLDAVVRIERQVSQFLHRRLDDRLLPSGGHFLHRQPSYVDPAMHLQHARGRTDRPDDGPANRLLAERNGPANWGLIWIEAAVDRMKAGRLAARQRREHFSTTSQVIVEIQKITTTSFSQGRSIMLPPLQASRRDMRRFQTQLPLLPRGRERANGWEETDGEPIEFGYAYRSSGSTVSDSPAANVRSPAGKTAKAFASASPRRSAEPAQRSGETVGARPLGRFSTAG